MAKTARRKKLRIRVLGYNRSQMELPPSAAERMAGPHVLAPAAQLDPDILYSPEELAEPAAALVAKMSLEEEASLC